MTPPGRTATHCATHTPHTHTHLDTPPYFPAFAQPFLHSPMPATPVPFPICIPTYFHLRHAAQPFRFSATPASFLPFHSIWPSLAPGARLRALPSCVGPHGQPHPIPTRCTTPTPPPLCATRPHPTAPPREPRARHTSRLAVQGDRFGAHTAFFYLPTPLPPLITFSGRPTLPPHPHTAPWVRTVPMPYVPQADWPFLHLDLALDDIPPGQALNRFNDAPPPSCTSLPTLLPLTRTFTLHFTHIRAPRYCLCACLSSFRMDARASSPLLRWRAVAISSRIRALCTLRHLLYATGTTLRVLPPHRALLRAAPTCHASARAQQLPITFAPFFLPLPPAALRTRACAPRTPLPFSMPLHCSRVRAIRAARM